MNSLEKMKAIVNHIQVVNPDTKVCPGLSKVEILEAFQKINLLPPPEIVELYQWHNGIGELDCFLNLMDLDNAVDWYKDFLASKTEYPEWKWDKNYFPLLNMNGDVQLCLDVETFAVMTIDIECNIVDKIANHYIDYLDALLHVFNSKSFKYDCKSGCIEFEQEVWNDARSLYQIEHPWLQGN